MQPFYSQPEYDGCCPRKAGQRGVSKVLLTCTLYIPQDLAFGGLMKYSSLWKDILGFTRVISDL